MKISSQQQAMQQVAERLAELVNVDHGEVRLEATNGASSADLRNTTSCWVMSRRDSALPADKGFPAALVARHRTQGPVHPPGGLLSGPAHQRARRYGPSPSHMLRHACGYALANKGHDLRTIQDYLGHWDPKHTAIYTRTAAKRFENLWR